VPEYKKNVKYQEGWEAIVAKGACQEAVVYFEAMLEDDPDLTWGGMLDVMIPDEEVPEDWAVWAWKRFRHVLDKEVRLYFMSKVVSPPLAFHLYKAAVCDYTLLDVDEETLDAWWQTFRGQVPNAEEQIGLSRVENGSIPPRPKAQVV